MNKNVEVNKCGITQVWQSSDGKFTSPHRILVEEYEEHGTTIAHDLSALANSLNLVSATGDSFNMDREGLERLLNEPKVLKYLARRASLKERHQLIAASNEMKVVRIP